MSCREGHPCDHEQLPNMKWKKEITDSGWTAIFLVTEGGAKHEYLSHWPQFDTADTVAKTLAEHGEPGEQYVVIEMRTKAIHFGGQKR